MYQPIPGELADNKTTMPTLTETSRRFNIPSEPLKIPTDRIQSAIQQMAQQERLPFPVVNALYASMWFLNVEAFRGLEEKFINSGEYEQALQDHRAMLANLIADGEALLNGARKNGMAETPENFTIEDIQATVDSLHADFLCEHGEKNSPEVNQIIEGLFNGEER
jgi:hypothetical protein